VGAEIELKLATSKRGLQQALALPWLKKQASDGSRKQELTSVYFDTDDFVLREHDISACGYARPVQNACRPLKPTPTHCSPARNGKRRLIATNPNWSWPATPRSRRS
jgi:hypothetical protein